MSRLILPYCIIAETNVIAPKSGIRQTAVEELSYQGLRCFVSRFAEPPETFTKEDALRFYSTVRAVFDQAAVVPFRFPTLLESEERLQQFLEEKAADYHRALQRLKNSVQMELRILPTNEKATRETSGQQYMAQRLKTKQALEAAASLARAAAAGLYAEWKQHEGREGVRCYALVVRQNAPQFQEKLKSFVAGDDVRVFVSGPWPATEFIE